MKRSKIGGQNNGSWGDPHPKSNKSSNRKLPQRDYIENADALWKQATKMPELSAKHYRQKFMKFIKDKRPTLWLTLTISRNSDHIEFYGAADRFIAAILQLAHGRKWSSLPLTIRPTVFGFLEQPFTNPHYNLLIKADEDFHLALLKHGKKTWRKFMRFSDYYLDPKPPADAALHYCSKEQGALDRFSTAYIYTPMRKTKTVKC